MYTIQALWTQAREGLDVTTVILSNRSYAILNLELARVGAGPVGPGRRASSSWRTLIWISSPWPEESAYRPRGRRQQRS